MNIGEAVQAIKSGKRVCRSGWNGKDMWLELQVPDAESKMTKSYIYMKTADDQLIPWLASQTDLLADDWCEYVEPFTPEVINDLKDQLINVAGEDARILALAVAETLGFDLDYPNEDHA